MTTASAAALSGPHAAAAIALQHSREFAADTMFDHYDFHGEVVCAEPWEVGMGEAIQRRVLVVMDAQGDEVQTAIFLVCFQSDSADVVDAFALVECRRFGQFRRPRFVH